MNVISCIFVLICEIEQTEHENKCLELDLWWSKVCHTPQVTRCLSSDPPSDSYQM